MMTNVVRITVPPLAVIGASTGGPKALAAVLSDMPGDLDGAVVVIQHVDKMFSAGLVGWLAGITSLKVQLAVEGERPKAGIVYVAGTDDHLIFGRDFRFSYIADRNLPYHPSIDMFFKSVLTGYHPYLFPRHTDQYNRCVAVLLTGMGRDGADGMKALREAGWHTIAQDEATSVVYGMPRAARDIGAVEQVLPLQDIGGEIVRIFNHHKKPSRKRF
jgi:two-component system response regulator WspF